MLRQSVIYACQLKELCFPYLAFLSPLSNVRIQKRPAKTCIPVKCNMKHDTEKQIGDEFLELFVHSR